MNKIALIACTKSKKSYACPAIELYSASDYFRKKLAYALKTLGADSIYILSTLHHLVPGDETVAPYELSFADMSAPEKSSWAEVTFKQIRETLSPDCSELILLCGRDFCVDLLPKLETAGYKVSTPLRGKGTIGQQIAWPDINTK